MKPFFWKRHVVLRRTLKVLGCMLLISIGYTGGVLTKFPLIQSPRQMLAYLELPFQLAQGSVDKDVQATRVVLYVTMGSLANGDIKRFAIIANRYAQLLLKEKRDAGKEKSSPHGKI